MPYVARNDVLGDPATGALALEAQKTIADSAAAAAANPDNAFTQANAAALAKQEYVNAVATGAVPSYITAPDDQAKFADLVDKINAGGFTSLSAEDQYAFNMLRTTGTAAPDDDARVVGGAKSGVYGWDPDSMTGDLPPGASRIAQVIQEHSSPDYQPPAPAPTTGHYITLQGGRYVYADDGSPVPPDELQRLGLSITSSSVSSSRPAASTGPGISSAPSDAAAVLVPNTEPEEQSPSSSKKTLMIAAGVGLGVLGLLAFSHKRR